MRQIGLASRRRNSQSNFAKNKRKVIALSTAAAGAALTLSSHPLHAANITYTTPTTSGNWSNATWTVTGGTGNTYPTTTDNGNIVRYNTAATASTLTLDVNATIGELDNANTGVFTISSGAGVLTFDGTGLLAANQAFGILGDAAIANKSTGTNGMTLNAPISFGTTPLDIGTTNTGGVSIGGAITATGNQNLNFRANGTGAITDSAAIGASGSSIAISNLGTSSGLATLSGNLGADVGSVTEFATGTSQLTLSGTNTSFAGAINLTTDEINLGSTGAIGGATSIAINGGTILNATVNSITTTAAPTIALDGNWEFAGNTLSLGTGAVTLTGSNVGIITNSTNNITLGGNISGSSSLTKTGQINGSFTNMGALVVNGNNSYTGGTIIQQGQIQFGAANSVPVSGNILLAPSGPNSSSYEGAAAIFNFALTQTQLGMVSGSSVGVVGLGIADGSALDFSSATGANLSNVSLGTQGNFTYSGTLTPWTSSNNGGYQLGGSGNQSQTGGSTLTVSTTLGNSVSATTGLTVDPTFVGFGAGSVILSNANTYTGLTTVNTGVLTVTGSLSSSTPLTINNSGTFAYIPTTGGSTQTVSGLTLGSGVNFVSVTGATNTLALGSITRSNSAAVDFNAAGLTGGITTTNSADASGNILGAGYLYNSGVNSTYAAVSGGAVTGLAYSATPTSAQGKLITDVGTNLASATTNYSLNTAPATAMTANSTANTLRYTAGTGVIEIGSVASNSDTFTANGIMNAGTGVLTIQDSGSGATGGLIIGATKELVLNTANNGITISAPIKDNANGASALTITGGNTVSLTGSNTYTGGTTVNQGILAVGNTTAGSANLGTGALTLSGGEFENLSATVISISNNIVFTQGTSSLVNPNTANITFTGGLTGSGTMFVGDGGTFASLTLSGDNSGFAGTLIYNGGGGSGDNFALGNTSAANNNLSQATLIGENEGTRRFNLGSTTGIVQLGALSGSLQLISTTDALQVGALNTNSVFGGQTSGPVALTKVGTGVFTVNGSTGWNPNDLTGLTINNGTLLADLSSLSTPTSFFTSSALNFNGGTLSILGKGTTLQNSSQAFSGTTFNAGASTIAVNNNIGTTGNTVATLVNLSRNVGGTVNFILPSGTQSATNGITSTSLQAGDIVQSTTNSVTYATVNGTDWATWGTSGGTQNIVARSSYTNDAFTGGDTNITTSDGPVGTSTNETTLRFNVDGVTLTLTGTGTGTSQANQVIYGGILTTANVNTTGATITGGALQTGGGSEFVFADYGKLTVNTLLINSGATATGVTALTKSGSGTLFLTNTSNAYSGINYLNAGTVNIVAAASLGTNATTSAISFNGGALQLASSFNLGSTQGINLGYKGGTFDTNTFNSTYSGTIASSAAVQGSVLENTADQFGFTKAGAGMLTITSAANTYAGATTITGGILSVQDLTSEGTAGNVASGIGKSGNYAKNLVLNGGTLQYNSSGAGQTTDRLFTLGDNSGSLDASGTGAINFSNTGSVAYQITTTGAATNSSPTLTLTGTNTGANTLAAAIGNNGNGTTAVVKNGTGQWVVTGSSAYTGSTTISNGILTVNASSTGVSTASLAATSSITVSSGATLHLLSSTSAPMPNSSPVYTSLISATTKLVVTGAASGQIDLDLAGNLQPVSTFTIGTSVQTPGIYGSMAYFMDNSITPNATQSTDEVYFAGDGAVAAPEPGSLGLLGLGAIGLMRRRRRSTKKIS